MSGGVPWTDGRTVTVTVVCGNFVSFSHRFFLCVSAPCTLTSRRDAIFRKRKRMLQVACVAVRCQLFAVRCPLSVVRCSWEVQNATWFPYILSQISQTPPTLFPMLMLLLVFSSCSWAPLLLGALIKDAGRRWQPQASPEERAQGGAASPLIPQIEAQKLRHSNFWHQTTASEGNTLNPSHNFHAFAAAKRRRESVVKGVAAEVSQLTFWQSILWPTCLSASKQAR